MRRILSKSFFDRSTLRVGPELLGKFLVRKIGTKIIAKMITEVEAYHGIRDLASHASRGRTSRTEVMFGPAGVWYVYLIYGMYHCLNVVTMKDGHPSAVLIRGVEGISGPGKVCRALEIDKLFNKKEASKINNLWIEDRGIKIPRSKMKRGIRIGIDYAGKWKEKKWRFYIIDTNTL